MSLNDKKQRRQSITSHYDNLISQIYKEPPVDILTFLCDDKYLGVSTHQGVDVFPVWKDALAKIFGDMSKLIVVLTGSVRTGKTTIAVYGVAYIMYRLLIAHDPWKYFGATKSSKMAIIFFNLSKTLGGSRGFLKLQSCLVNSPWFREHASYVKKTKGEEELEFALFEFLLASPYSQGFGITGSDVVAGILDEVDSEESPLSQKKRVLSVYDAAQIRFKTTFAPTGTSLGKLFVVSSKQDELSFMDAFIAKRKNWPEVIIFDIALWDAQKSDRFSGKKFPVAIGDTYNPPKIIEEGQEAEYISKGYTITRVPIEFLTEFKSNLIKALREIAGITVAGIRKSKLFATKQDILNCIDSSKEDPVKVQEIITGLQDKSEFIKYFDLSKIRLPKSTPRYMHYDISFSGSGDATSLSMCGVKEWKAVDVRHEDGSYGKDYVPIIETDFTVRIKSTPGDRILFHKVRKLVLDIRAAGYKIVLFTVDLKNMSEDTQQLLTSAGITTDDLSLDRTIQPYFTFRDLVYEHRWVCHRLPLLITELDSLEHDKIENKIDHPIEFIDTESGSEEKVLEGTKDLADATAGAVYNALKDPKKPMDFHLMSKLMDKTANKTKEDEEDVSQILAPKEGERVIGTKTSEGIDKINDIFRRMHPNRG